MIQFNIPPITGFENKFVIEAIQQRKLSGDGPFTKKCQEWFESQLQCLKALLTPSCTHALEMAAILIDIRPGDEVIMPSYTFVSTANPFVLRGAKIIFIDVRPDTMNINEALIEKAITSKTKAIVPVHYAGVPCEMDTIMDIANKYKVFVIEDAAQGMMSLYKGRKLGTIGHIGTYSFHETKNYTSGGEGGLIIINDNEFVEKAEIIREKGTNRGQFFRGMVDKYSWVDIGSSYLPSELQAAFLYAQLEKSEEINLDRLNTWNRYFEGLKSIAAKGQIILPTIPLGCEHNGHMFYIKTKNLEERTLLIKYLRKNDILAVFHYIPLHSSLAGKKFSQFCGNDKYTTDESERLVRLPMYFGIMEDDVNTVINTIKLFYSDDSHLI